MKLAQAIIAILLVASFGWVIRGMAERWNEEGSHKVAHLIAFFLVSGTLILLTLTLHKAGAFSLLVK